MNFEQLNYVKTVYEQESIIHASELMHISQSAMSQSIAHLEEELGYKLFYRSRKGTVPTEIGKRLIPKILDIIESRHALLSEVDSIETSFEGRIKIATNPTLFHKLLPKVLSKFKKDHPNVDIEVIESDKEDIQRKIENHDIDLGLIGKTDKSEVSNHITEFPLYFGSNFKLIVPAKSKLSFKETIELEDIKDYPFVLYDRSFYHHHLKKFQEANGDLKIVFRTNNPIVLMRTVAEGLGVGIVSSFMVENEPFLNNELIEALPLGQSFDYTVNFVAITHQEQQNEPTVLEFINYLKDYKNL
ncbi:LysR family transcriptional regulator [Staphylococcus haemolyticus]|uniref:LysR family transcriptional regulator n=1 Tax=Staphylococcus haemolyticus TaxID=1283 RepID=UPI00069DADCB|nr:LysR family transcriptional regulator [Staphylococcus haemolyticus]MCH4458395.1 LysR family transcriptional regulator [Staphylococcus haemolyticus]MDU0435595.1 LysR family transcriptional regulator [Staphylococcus haemolyticus]NKN67277.1 LysR family transcriptional regulator [Staphylococcus haemolyticus]PTK74609.1 LysR family transcriptional regulator [Staphylococcus haemolyticus]PTL11336.1 LysR family transcriptional regulator [Staphylococcus haemolyticus]